MDYWFLNICACQMPEVMTRKGQRNKNKYTWNLFALKTKRFGISEKDDKNVLIQSQRTMDWKTTEISTPMPVNLIIIYF